MELDRSLLKEFARIANDEEEPGAKQYVRGTVTSGGEGNKYVVIDGSDQLTPISEVVDVESGDRVLVSIENHKATIIGNFTFSPSARKEQAALDKSEQAVEESNQAMAQAQSAKEKAETAITESSVASALAQESKNESAGALEAAQNASQNATQAKQESSQALEKAGAAQTSANEAKDSVSAANRELSAVKTDVAKAKTDISSALEDLESQAGEISSIKETYSTKVETEKVQADLTTEITKKVGELQTTVSENYALKTDVVEMEGTLRTQITQTAEGLSSQATKIEKLQSDTTAAQKNVEKALSDASAAQLAADAAKADADNAQAAADAAQADATSAQTKADNAQKAADAAQKAVDTADKSLQQAKQELTEAKQNLANVTSRVDATEEEIAAAQEAVNTANTNVNKALADVAEAKNEASKATTAAQKAQSDADSASQVAASAQTKADNAKTTADNASKAAAQAQADVAALSNRVTTAETAITQNTEAIELRATKTEVTQSVNDINTNLTSNYYNKTQADAAIKTASDSITLSVSKTYSVKSSTMSSSVEQFYQSTSPTSLTGGTWSNKQPAWTDGKYIWRRTLVTYGDGTTSYTPSQNGVCITGNTGATGAAGKGVKSTAVTYQAWSNGTSTPTGTWSNSPPATTADKPYLWTKTVITYTDNTTSTSYSVGSTPEGIVVGGRNLLKDTDIMVQATSSAFAQISTSTIYVVDGLDLNDTFLGKTTIFSYYVHCPGERTNSTISNGNRFGIHGTVVWENKSTGETKTIYPFADCLGGSFTNTRVSMKYNFIPPDGCDSISRLYFSFQPFAKPSSTTEVWKLGKPKLELGNKATDWTPAPEDVESSIQDKIADATTSITTSYESLIKTTEKNIAMSVSEVTSKTNEIETSLGTLKTTVETNAGIFKVVDEVKQQVENLKTGKVDEDWMKQWMKYENGVLSLASTNNAFSCKLTQSELAFYDGSDKVAWISNNELHILTAIITQSIGVGNFTWVDEGNLGFSLI